AGKILGLGFAGLLQSTTYLAIGIPVISLMTNKGIGWLILSLIYAVLGYLIYASIMAISGIITNCEREGNQIASMWMFIGIFPLIILLATIPSADSWAVRFCSFFPLTASITMIFRMGLTEVGTMEIIFSMISLMISVHLAVWASAKIFRTASLLYGK